jgi:hypothetical protein
VNVVFPEESFESIFAEEGKTIKRREEVGFRLRHTEFLEL